MVSEVIVRKNSKQKILKNISLGWKSNCREAPYKILDSLFNHKVIKIILLS